MKNKIKIIYSDDDLIVINKPSGISVTKDRSGAIDLLPALQKKFSIDSELRLIHRLDKDTSGVMLLAKNPETQSIYASCFEKRRIKKTYLALVSGIVMHEKGSVKTPISREDKNTNLMKVNPRTGKPAVTNYTLLADYGLLSLLAVTPVTGRTHQIRLHLSSINLPLAIDPLYGGTNPVMLSDFKADYRTAKGKEERPLIERLTLHAYQLELPEIESRPARTFVAGFDKKFAATIKMLTKHNVNGNEAFVNQEIFGKIINAQPLNI